MLAKNKLQERVKERTSSSRSVTSIEMEGDNLVVVTEEVDDSIFLDDNQPTESAKQPSSTNNMVASGQNNNSNSGQNNDSSLVSESQSSHLHVDENNENSNSGSTTPSPSPSRDDVVKLKSSLDLKLNVDADGLPIDNTSDVLTTPEISITRSRTSSGSSSLTSGPDSRPPSPITPPELDEPNSPRRVSETDSEAGSGIHNCTFPNNSVSYTNSPGGTLRNVTAKEQVCGVFSVDLGQ